MLEIVPRIPCLSLSGTSLVLPPWTSWIICEAPLFSSLDCSGKMRVMWKPLSSLGELHPVPSDLHIWQMVPSPASISRYLHDLGVQVANSLFPQTQIPPFSESRSPGSLSPTPQYPKSLKPLLSRLKSLPLFLRNRGVPALSTLLL